MLLAKVNQSGAKYVSSAVRVGRGERSRASLTSNRKQNRREKNPQTKQKVAGISAKPTQQSRRDGKAILQISRV